MSEMSDDAPAINGKTGKPMPLGKRFQPGQSGNPNGRPKVVADLRALCQAEGENSWRTILEIRDDPKAPHTARLAAAMALWDRGYGRAIQRQEHTGADGGPIQTQQIADDRLPVTDFLAEFATAKRDEAKH